MSNNQVRDAAVLPPSVHPPARLPVIMDIIEMELKDVSTSQVVVGLAQGHCPSRYRERWRFGKTAKLREATEGRLRTEWEHDDSTLATEPLFAHFLRAYLDELDAPSAARQVNLLELRMELHAAILHTDMRTQSKLARLVDVLGGLAPDGMHESSSQAGRVLPRQVAGALRSIKSAQL